MTRFSLCLAVLAIIATTGLAEDVLTLTGSTFSEAVKKHDKLVVEFYAPWCGHCKSLAPEYEKAAGLLKSEGIVLAKVDATEEENKAIASKFGVRGFPTLKIFRGDEESASEYEGPRQADGIVSYSKSQFGPAFTEVKTADDVTKLQKPVDEITVLGVFPAGESSEAAAAFKAAAEALRGDGTFALTTDASLVKEAEGKDAIFVYKDFDDPVTTFAGTFEKSAIAEFVEKASTPKLLHLDQSPRNKKALSAAFADSKPKFIGAMAPDHASIKEWKDTLMKVQETFDNVIVLYMDPTTNAGALKFFNIEEKDLPLVAVHDAGNDAKYLSKTLTPGEIMAWATDYNAGKIEKVVKSEEIPASNDGPVKVVVHKTFNDIVMSGKNVLIEFYAPWCGHCKKLEPVYNELGEAFKDNDKVVIAKMDATANDVPDTKKFEVKGFPTIMWVTSSGKISKYEGSRDLEGFKTFINKELGEAPAANTEASATDTKDEL